jgi:hypothetical protein
MPPVADHLEHGKSSVVGNDRLAIDQARTNRQGVHRRCHIGEACGEVVAIAGDEPDTAGISPRDDAEAVVLDLMNPARSGWRRFGWRWQARLDETGATAPIGLIP